MLDMMGKPCPIPVIEAKKALADASPGERVELLVDNDVARQNLEKMARDKGCGFSFAPGPQGGILVTLTAPEGAACETAREGGYVVAIGKNAMGAGSDELGETLMKSYLYSLTELDTPPEMLLFFNGGVKLTTEGSAALEDLRALESKGTQISSCGACLNYYGLTERLQVGNITNMYAIASAMATAQRLINL